MPIEKKSKLILDDEDDPMGLPSNDEGGPNVGGGALKKGPWTTAEDKVLEEYVQKHGEGSWNAVQKRTQLSQSGKSCRLRWINHLRPNLKKSAFTPEEEQKIAQLHATHGNKWSRMAAFATDGHINFPPIEYSDFDGSQWLSQPSMPFQAAENILNPSDIILNNMIENSGLDLQETEWEGYKDPNFPLSSTIVSTFNQFTAPTIIRSLDEHAPLNMSRLPLNKTSSENVLPAVEHVSTQNVPGKDLPPNPYFSHGDA